MCIDGCVCLVFLNSLFTAFIVQLQYKYAIFAFTNNLKIQKALDFLFFTETTE